LVSLKLRLDELLMEANERDKLRGAELEDFIGYL
jgi:hypothetical protein